MKPALHLAVIFAVILLTACSFSRKPVPQPVVSPPLELSQHCDEVIGAPQVEELAPGVWIARGYDLANTILIASDEGHVIIDAGMSPARAQPVREALLAEAPGSIRAVVYTHSHIDHIGGASVWLEEGTEIWATESFVEHVVKQYGRFQRAEAARGRRQFGMHVPEASLPCSAIGARVDIHAALESGFRMPTHTFSGTARLEVGGRSIELVEAHGETHDQLFVWLPEERVLMPGDNYYHTFPNLYTIRGTAPRPIDSWIRSLDQMRAYEPEVLAPAHTYPVRGSEEIQRRLRDYRDAIQWIRDDVVRLATAGKGIEEIVASVRLPAHLAEQPYLAELYGQVDWSVRAIYSNELGWFDGDAVGLYTHPATETARREVLAMGGATTVFEQAVSARATGDPRWAVHLLAKVRSSGLPVEGRSINEELAAALRDTAADVTNTNGRAYLLESAHELIHGATRSSAATFDDPLLAGVPLYTIFDVMSGRLFAQSALDVHESVVWNFPETGERFVMTIRNGVAELVVGDALPGTPEPLAVVTADPMTWRRLATQSQNPLTALASGGLRIEGSQLGFLRFVNRFDRDF